MQKTESQYIKTGLPYDLDQMENIAQNGAIVDISDIKFPGLPDSKKVRTAYIFLRNTGFENIILDFQKANYKTKSDFLITYLQDTIENNNQEIYKSWITILFDYNNIENCGYSILTKEEEDRFIEENKDFIHKISNIIFSIPVMLLNRLKDKNWNFDIKKDNAGELNLKNLAMIISDPSIEDWYINLNCDKYELTYYEDIFNEEENDLFINIMKSPLFIFMFGLSTTPVEEFDELIKACVQ